MPMLKEYDMADAVRGSVLRAPGRTRVTVLLDREILEALRQRASDTGCGFQTAINRALREHLASSKE